MYEVKFLQALLMTVASELGVAMLFKRWKPLSAIPYKDFVLTVALASCLTLPYLWFILPSFIDVRYYVIVGECLIALVEGGIYFQYFKIRWYEALLLSIVANGFSYFIGWLCW
jgi:hypothetical protein